LAIKRQMKNSTSERMKWMNDMNEVMNDLSGWWRFRVLGSWWRLGWGSIVVYMRFRPHALERRLHFILR